MKMTKRLLLLAAVLAAALLLNGCDGVSYDITTFGSKTTVQVNDVGDGADAESIPLSVGKNRHATVTSELNKGQLQIDFVEVTVFAREGEADEVIYGDTAASVTVAPGGAETVPLDKGDYVARFTAIGETGGTVIIQIEKD